MENNNIKHTHTSFAKGLISVILPLTFQFFLFSLMPVCDAIMLVKLDQDSMSAVSLAAQAMFVLNIFIYAIITGMSMFAAQFWGKGDIRSIRNLMGYAMRLTVLILIAFFAAAFFMPEGVMLLYTNEPQIVEYGIGYLRIVSFAYIFDGIAQVYVTALKNSGMVKQSTAISIIMLFLNVGLNAVFIYGLLGMPMMGARGAALGTTISCFVGLIMSMGYFYGKCKIDFSIRDILAKDKKIREDFNTYAWPVLLNQILWGIGFTMITVIMGHLGSDAVAANSIVAVVKDLVSCFCFALASGGAIIIGNELGAGRLDRAREYGSKLCHLATISGIIAGVLIAAMTPVITAIADLTPQATDYLRAMLLMCIYYMVGRSLNSVVISGIFCAGGDTRFGMICDGITMWAFIVPVGALAAFVFKLPVLWVYFILNLDEIVKLPAVYIHYKKYKWVKNLVGD